MRLARSVTVMNVFAKAHGPNFARQLVDALNGLGAVSLALPCHDPRGDTNAEHERARVGGVGASNPVGHPLARPRRPTLSSRPER
jgi:hypothetical protein